ncbi:hypothetical protein D3C72_2219830 [compost metagenome]
MNLHQAGMVWVASHHGVILQLAKALSETHMFGMSDVLIAQEQHAMLEQLNANLGEQAIVMDGIREFDADQLRADGAGQLFDFHGRRLP